jgi:hypothetical protein
MVYRGYFFGRGRVFTYSLDDYPELLDAHVTWAGYDGVGRLVVARSGAVERYNRSYDYMPGPESWAAVDQALRTTGLLYPTDGFSDIYPHEGTWDKILAMLRA